MNMTLAEIIWDEYMKHLSIYLLIGNFTAKFPAPGSEEVN